MLGGPADLSAPAQLLGVGPVLDEVRRTEALLPAPA